ncbi:MAG TPA: potassium channel protein [Bryobacterales bacterium]|nr:potassium channel protein [Bryobacterales bacterium]
MNSLWRRVGLMLLVMALVLAFGTAGFVWIEHWPWFDAFYMALITLTTVGYAEVHPLSHTGRIFNSILIAVGVTTVFLAIGVIAQFAIQAELGAYFGRRRQKRMLDKLSDHYIVCGGGRVGRSVIRELARNNAPFVLVDSEPERAEWAMELGYMAVIADATQEETLQGVHIERASGLVAALPTDAQNVYVVLTARNMNPGLRIVARAADEQAHANLKRAGANAMFTPYSYTGHRLAQALLRPHVVSFLDMASAFEGSDLDLSIEQIRVGAESPCAAQTLEQARLPQKFGIIVLAVMKTDGKMQFNPSGQTAMQPGDVLIAIGETTKLRRLEAHVGR